LDSYRLSLKAYIQNLISLLLLLIEDQCLPDQRLKLEMLTESQITSREHTAQLLKELFKFSDNCLSPLVETSCSDLFYSITEASTYSLKSFEEQASGTALSDSPILG
jgi:hypothetical protein